MVSTVRALGPLRRSEAQCSSSLTTPGVAPRWRDPATIFATTGRRAANGAELKSIREITYGGATRSQLRPVGPVHVTLPYHARTAEVAFRPTPDALSATLKMAQTAFWEA